MKNKITIIALVVVLIFSLVTNIKHITNENQEKLVFLRTAFHYNTSINSGLKKLQNAYSTGNYANFNNEIKLIIKNTYLLDELLKNGSYFVDDEIGYLGINYGYQYISYAFEGSLSGNKYQGAFIADGVISEKEIKFIDQLSSDLGELLSAMSTENGQNIKPHLTIGDFKNSLKVFLKKWDIAAERSTLGYSPYDYLLLKK